MLGYLNIAELLMLPKNLNLNLGEVRVWKHESKSQGEVKVWMSRWDEGMKTWIKKSRWGEGMTGLGEGMISRWGEGMTSRWTEVAPNKVLLA